MKKVVVEIINNCLHEAMVMIEEHDEDIQLLVNAGDGFKNIRESSDGLNGDLFYWIDEFSEEEKYY